MTVVTLPNELTNATVADADQVQANFDAIVAVLNGALGTDNLGAALAAMVDKPGVVKMTAAATPDTGWLLCDGSAVSRSTYSALFARIGTAHGAGDGSTTFNLPDLRGRSPIGAGAGAGLTARALGDKVGEETHRLTTSELAAHSHTAGAGGNGKTSWENSSLGHSHAMLAPAPGRSGGSSWSSTQTPSAGSGLALQASVVGGTISDMNGTTNNGPFPHDHMVTINNSGGDGAHNNMQPSTAVNFQIKT